MADGPAVSVITCFLNAERFIAEAIASVQAQTDAAWELLLVDDGSTDGSRAIAEDWAGTDARIRVLEHPARVNRGISRSRNLGIEHARAPLIAFLDADDVYLPHRLARSRALLETHPATAMVYGTTEYWYSWRGDGRADRVQPHGFRADRVVPAPDLLMHFLTHRAALPCIGSLLVRRTAILHVEGFEDSFRTLYEDQAFLAKICLRSDVYVSSECWDRYRQHDASICAVAEARGEMDGARQTYYAWLREYMGRQGVTDPRVWRALEHAERHAHSPRRTLRSLIWRFFT